MNTHQYFAVEALQNMKGDNTSRARSAFLGMSPEQLNEQHGESGKTRKQILAEFEALDNKIDSAIAWVKNAHL